MPAGRPPGGTPIPTGSGGGGEPLSSGIAGSNPPRPEAATLSALRLVRKSSGDRLIAVEQGLFQLVELGLQPCQTLGPDATSGLPIAGLAARALAYDHPLSLHRVA